MLPHSLSEKYDKREIPLNITLEQKKLKALKKARNKLVKILKSSEASIRKGLSLKDEVHAVLCSMRLALGLPSEFVPARSFTLEDLTAEIAELDRKIYSQNAAVLHEKEFFQFFCNN